MWATVGKTLHDSYMKTLKTFDLGLVPFSSNFRLNKINTRLGSGGLNGGMP